MSLQNITWEDFEKIDIRTGTILTCKPFPEARKPAYKLSIDFGETLGIKMSSAQITSLYKPEDLVGLQVTAVVNFPPRQIANFFSEVLVLGIYGDEGNIILLQPRQPVKNGAKIG